MDFFALRCFVEVVREGGFTRAADRVLRTQPAVSAQVRKLEEELGGPLFDRSLPSPALTERGRELYPRALRLLEEADALEAELRSADGEPRGRVTLASGLAAIEGFLPPVLGPFRARFPKVRMTLLNRSSEGILRAVLDGRADLGLGWLPGGIPRLRMEEIGTVRFAALRRRRKGEAEASRAAEPPSGTAAIAEAAGGSAPETAGRPENLAREPLLLFEKGIDLRTYVEGRLGPVEAVLELPSVGSLVSYAERGFGTAIVPVLGTPRLPSSLEVRYLDRLLPPLPLRLCEREGSVPSGAAALLGEAVRAAALTRPRPAAPPRACPP